MFQTLSCLWALIPYNLRAGFQGSRYNLLLPEPLRMSSHLFPICEDALAVPPTIIEVFDTCLHTQNYRFFLLGQEDFATPMRSSVRLEGR